MEVIRSVSPDGSSVAQINICRDSGLSDDERRIRDIRERWARQEADARRLRGRLCLAGVASCWRWSPSCLPYPLVTP